MLNEKNLPKSYWVEAVVYLMNLLITFGIHDVTPHEKCYGRKPDLSHLRYSTPLHLCTFHMEKGKSLIQNRGNAFSSHLGINYETGQWSPSNNVVSCKEKCIISQSTRWNTKGHICGLACPRNEIFYFR